jgi:hypothetical protein
VIPYVFRSPTLGTAGRFAVSREGFRLKEFAVSAAIDAVALGGPSARRRFGRYSTFDRDA